MGSEISIGIFLPSEKLNNNQLKKLKDLKNWLNGFNIKKIVLTMPNIEDKLEMKLKKIFRENEKDIELIFEEGKEIFFGKIKTIFDKVRDNEIKIKEIDEDFIDSLFDGPSNLDLIIKVGEKRLPNAFIWQKSYSELFFVDRIEEFNQEIFEEIIKDFKKRERRFGE